MNTWTSEGFSEEKPIKSVNVKENELEELLSDGELLDNVIQYLENIIKDTPPLLTYLSRDKKHHLYITTYSRLDLARDLLTKITEEFKYE